MALRSVHSSIFAFYPEVTQGLAPADAAAWAADGQPIDHYEADVTEVKQELVQDTRMDTRPYDHATATMLKGLRNCAAKTSHPLHGSGVTTAGGAQISETRLMRLLKHCYGGIHRSNSTTITGGSATEPELTAVTNIIPGCLIGFEDTTSPTAEHSGLVFVRQVKSIDTLTVTLDEALPFTPAATDKVHAIATIFPSSDRIDMSDPVQTYSLLLQKHPSDADKLWQLHACAGSLSIKVERGQEPRYEIAWQAANFKHGADGGLTAPTWGNNLSYGFAPLVVGRNTKVSIGEYDTTTASDVHVHQAEVMLGFPAIRVPGVVEVDDLVEGTKTYGANVLEKPGMTLTTLPHTDDWEVALQADTEYRVRLTQHAAPGKVWCFYMPRAQLGETPGPANVADRWGSKLKFNPRPADNCTGGSNTDLEKALMLIGIG
jgi:hypothetical protein